MLTQTLFVTIHGGDSGASLVSISSGACFALPGSGAGHVRLGAGTYSIRG